MNRHYYNVRHNVFCLEFFQTKNFQTYSDETSATCYVPLIRLLYKVANLGALASQTCINGNNIK